MRPPTNSSTWQTFICRFIGPDDRPRHRTRTRTRSICLSISTKATGGGVPSFSVVAWFEWNTVPADGGTHTPRRTRKHDETPRLLPPTSWTNPVPPSYPQPRNAQESTHAHRHICCFNPYHKLCIRVIILITLDARIILSIETITPSSHLPLPPHPFDHKWTEEKATHMFRIYTSKKRHH